MPEKVDIHVSRRNVGWIVRRDDTIEEMSVHKSQREAIEVGRKIARKDKVQLIIHGRDNRVRKRISYRVGPLPPPRPPEVLYPSGRPSASKKEIRRILLEIAQTRKTSLKRFPRHS